MSRWESESTPGTGQRWLKIELSHGQDSIEKREEDSGPEPFIGRVDLHLRFNDESKSRREFRWKVRFSVRSIRHWACLEPDLGYPYVLKTSRLWQWLRSWPWSRSIFTLILELDSQHYLSRESHGAFYLKLTYQADTFSQVKAEPYSVFSLILSLSTAVTWMVLTLTLILTFTELNSQTQQWFLIIPPHFLSYALTLTLTLTLSLF